MSLHLALYQPDIPQNVGAAMRLCACLDVRLHIIEPCGFPWDMRKIRQAGMDYVDAIEITRHESWDAFRQNQTGRLLLMTTKGALPYTQFEYREGDILLAGRESAGVPGHVHEAAGARLVIPMQPGIRSLNIINAGAMVLGEALRQTDGFTTKTT